MVRVFARACGQKNDFFIALIGCSPYSAAASATLDGACPRAVTAASALMCSAGAARDSATQMPTTYAAPVFATSALQMSKVGPGICSFR